MKLSRLVAAVFLFVTAISTARAQLPALDPLTAPMGEAIAKAKLKSVIVLDFSGPGERDTALGQALAEKFSMALSKSSDKFSVAARGQIGEALAKDNVPQSSFNDLSIAIWVAGELNIRAVITGRITVVGDRLGISVGCYRTDSGKRVNGFDTTSTISEEMRQLMNKVVEYPARTDSSIPASGENGYTYPKCEQCPPAAYDPRAIKHHYKGTVTLSVVIGVDGRATNIVVLKALPYGLTAKAVEAVASWKFKPAQNSHGSPAAVRQLVEVAFHLN
ncbi:MAG: energy transducer TonB [Candidatus Acidiferrales bacterium]